MKKKVALISHSHTMPHRSKKLAGRWSIAYKAVAVTAMILGVSIGLNACSFDKPLRPDALTVDKANNLYARGRFFQASEDYQKALSENPDSPYIKTSLIGLADSFYKDQDYFQASLYYERFLEQYPLDRRTSRALFYLGMCNYHDSFDPDRDQANSEKAITVFTAFEKKYPDNLLVPKARELRQEMQRSVVDAEIGVVRFYSRVNRNTAVIRRVKMFLSDRPDSPHAPEATFLLAQAYQREQAYKKAASVYTVLIEKYPDSEYADRAAERAKKLKISEK